MEGKKKRRNFTISWIDPEERKFRLELGKKTLVMGVLNLTPDSFYDGGHYQDPARAAEWALAMEAEGADIIDIGGESSRPGAETVTAREELKRVLPLLERLRGVLKIPLSIDSYKAVVARAALENGAQIINDISALRFDSAMSEVAAAASGPVILMHMKGTPRKMQRKPEYEDVVAEIRDFFRKRLEEVEDQGIDRGRVILDPGIGFGKTLKHNLQIIGGLPGFADLGRPLLVGPSRKSFVGMLLNQPVEERLWGTAGAVAAAVWGGAHIVRVHDVKQMKDVVAVVDAIVTFGR